MSKKPCKRSDADALRRRAEARLSERGKGEDAWPATEAEMRRLIYELQVHQIQLEMQNEEFLRSRAEVEAGLKRYADLYDLAPVGYLTLGRDGTIRQINLAAARMLGEVRPRLEGRRLGLFVSEADRPAFSDLLQKVLEGQGGGSCEVALDRDEAHPLSDLLSGSADTGKASQLIVRIEAAPTEDGRACRAVVMDITERKQTEARIAERTAELEQRNTQLRDLAAEISRVEQRGRQRLAQALHDGLQQSLVAARFRLKVLQGRLADSPLAGVAGEIDDLLAQSIQASRALTIELSPPVLFEGSLVAVLRWLARWMEEHHGLAVHLEADDSLAPESDSERLLVFQCVRELLFNIVKHAGVQEASVQLSSSKEEGLRILVSDQGVGFDPARVRSGGSLEGGYGLFSVQQRLEALGGSLLIESAPGQGTRVTARVPLRAGAAAPAGSNAEAGGPDPAPCSQPRIRILLADDHTVVRQGLAQIIADEADMEVVGQAADGQAALELARALRPDVVLMDIVMPRLNGIEATRSILAEMPQVRVVALSMHDHDEKAAAMSAAGAAAYLTKDGPVETLLSTVRGVCGERR